MDFTTLTHCPACDKSAFTPLPRPGHWIGGSLFEPLREKIGLNKCRACSLVFINPRPDQEALNSFYSGNTYDCHESAGSASAGAKAEFLLDKMQESASPEVPRTLLDFGCGGGGFLRHALARKWDARGFEPGRRGYLTCKEGGLDVVDQLSSLPSNYFGLVTMHHVFEHLEGHAGVLDAVRNLLVDGGQLFIEVPNADSLRAQLSLPILSQHMRFDERYRAYPIHLSYFNEKSLTLLMHNAGWQLDRVFTAGMGLEELITRDETVRPSSTAKPSTNGSTSGSSPIRRAVKSLLYGAGLGENLCIIARPLPR
jgi:SAM-dependent methyltransferase